MKIIAIAIITTILSFLFLHKPLTIACGGKLLLWKALVFDLLVGILTYMLLS